MQYDAVLFDLDGTLLNTLSDLADGVNAALASMGYPTRSIDEVCAFVGNGVRRLIELAIPEAEHMHVDECLRRFHEEYDARLDAKTRPYPGVIDLLSRMYGEGVKVGVVSNKYDKAVKYLCSRFFGELTPVAIGEREGIRRKPAPDSLLEAMRLLGADAARTLYVGDSSVDIQTAHNAGLLCVSVAWGFRTREQLSAAGADVIIDRPEEFEDAARTLGALPLTPRQKA